MARSGLCLGPGLSPRLSALPQSVPEWMCLCRVWIIWLGHLISGVPVFGLLIVDRNQPLSQKVFRPSPASLAI